MAELTARGQDPKRRKLLSAAQGVAPAADSAQEGVTSPQQPGPAATAEEDDGFDDVPMPSDVEASFLFLRNEMQNTQSALQLKEVKNGRPTPTLPPVVLVTQIMSLLKDKREVEAELDTLRRKNTIRMFKLATGVDEHGVMLTSDYTRVIREAADKATQQDQQAREAEAAHEQGNERPMSAQQPATTSSGPSTTQAIADAFCTHVVPHHTEVTISQSHLLILIRASQPSHTNHNRTHSQQGSGAYNSDMYEKSIVTSAGSVSADTVLATLLQLGVLSRHPADDMAYVLGCPALGLLVKSVLAGRKELLAIIAKKPKGEVSERTLLGNPLTGPRTATGQQRRPAAPSSTEGGFLRPLVIEVQLESAQTAGQGSGAGGGRGGKGKVKEKKAGTTVVLPADTRGPGTGTVGVKLRQSQLSVRYHLRDLLGRGDVVRVQTPSGDLIRLVKKS